MEGTGLDNATRLYRIRRTCNEMLADRGYVIGTDEMAQTLDEFKEKFTEEPKREDLSLLWPHSDDPSDQIFVFFPSDAKVGVKTIKTYAEQMKSENVHRAILVVQAALTAFARQALAELSSAGKYHIEQFVEAELLINITEHVLVPPHTKLKPQEKKELLQRYKVKETQLPRIQHSDPVARYYGLARGDVVRIVRPSETAGRYVTYRFCV